MNTSEMKAVCRKLFDAITVGDVEALRAIFTQDTQWWMPPSGGDRYERPLRGGDRVADLVSGKLLQSFQPGTTTWTIMHMTAEDDHVAVLANRRAVAASNGADYYNEYHLLFRFEDGLIAESWEVVDTSHAQKIFTQK